jgi:hypothetical protein
MEQSEKQKLIEVNLSKYPFVQNGIAFVSLARRAFQGEKIKVYNCKSHWVPFFIYLEIEIGSIKKDGTFCDELNIIEYCQRLDRMQLRLFLETIASQSALLSDALYQVDQTKPVNFDEEILVESKKIPITNWQSYNRSYILNLDKEILKYKTNKKKALILFCRGTKPYSYEKEEILEYLNEEYEHIVISSIGIIPKVFWEHPVVMTYSTGCPDIFRVYQLVKKFFENNAYEEILCYLDYSPYIEILEILQKTHALNIKFFKQKKYKEFGPRYTKEFI